MSVAAGGQALWNAPNKWKGGSCPLLHNYAGLEGKVNVKTNLARCTRRAARAFVYAVSIGSAGRSALVLGDLLLMYCMQALATNMMFHLLRS